jgi:hypothetical protein
MSSKGEELKDRVEARKHQMLSKYNELKADTRKEASEARMKLKARLDELEGHIKGGWHDMSESVKSKLNQWLDQKD